jgi:ssDNA-binding Zn-finger/Zn-ribbon topoisomerase 1
LRGDEVIGKLCPNCSGEMAIWHATIYRVVDPAILTKEKEKELNEWVDEIVKPKLKEIFDSIENKPDDFNRCPHCGKEFIIENIPVSKVKTVT